MRERLQQTPAPLSDDTFAEIGSTLFAASSGAMFVVDNTAAFVEVNAAGCELAGYTRKALLQMGVPDLFFADGAGERPWPYANLVRAGSHRQGGALRTKSGKLLSVEVESYGVGNGRWLLVVYTAVVSQPADTLDPPLVQIGASVPGMICAYHLHTDGSISMPYTTAALDEIYGLDAALLAKDATLLFDIMHPDDIPRVQATIAQSAETMTQWHAEYRIQHPRKGEIWVEGRSMPERQPDGSILWYGFVQDVTQRKLAERAIYLMSGAQKQIARFETLEEVYQLVGQKVQELIGEGYTVVSMLDETLMATRLVGMYGFGSTYDALVRWFNVDPAELSFPLAEMTAAELELFRSGRLEKFEGSLYAKLARKVPQSICEIVEEALEIRAIYTMGFIWNDAYYGGLTILTRRDIEPYREMITTIVSQASLAIKRIRSEAALRESQYILTTAESVAHMGSWKWDLATQKTTWSEGMYTLFEVDAAHRDSDVNEMIQLRVHPDDREMANQAAVDTFVSHKPVSLECRLVLSDGTERVIWEEGRMVAGPDGRPTTMIGYAQDITDRKRVETALQEMAENMAAAQHMTHSGSWEVRLTPDLQFADPQMWSDECFRIFGVEPGSVQMTSEFFYQHVHPADREAAWQALRRAVHERTEAAYEYRLIRPDGSVRSLSDRVKVVMDERDRPVKVVGIVQDVTESRQAEAMISQLNRRMELVLNSAGEGIYGADLDGRITFVNPAMAHMTGWEPEELLGQNAHAVFHPTRADGSPFPVAECEVHAAVLNGRAYHTDEDTFWRKDGKPVVVDYTGTPVWQEGQLLGSVMIVKDITERKRAAAEQARLEEQLRQAQKMESIGRLAGGVAHDFNNQLTIMQIYGDLMRAEMGQDHPLLPKLAHISQATEHAAGLTRQLLAFSRQQILQPVVVNLNNLVANLQNMLARLIGEDILLSTVLQPELWSIKADPGQIEQVIMNLVVNARDAMPTGGLLTIETQNIVLDESIATSRLEAPLGPCVLLAVTDTGHGMDENIKGHIFEPFFTTKQPGQGTGLGLSTVHGIVKQSGGAIFVYSELNQGTTFKIYLPAHKTAVFQPAPKQPERVRHGDETILLVEDEEVVRDLVRFTLEALGYTVLEAQDAGQALYLAGQHQAPIDLLLTDVVMPQVSGRELAQALSTQRPEIKVLFMSGYMDDAVVRHGLLTAEVDLLPKPFTHNVLAARVREILDR